MTAQLLHLCADGDAPLVVEHDLVVGARAYERVTDYAYATPGGLRWLALHDLARPVDTGADVSDLADHPDVAGLAAFTDLVGGPDLAGRTHGIDLAGLLGTHANGADGGPGDRVATVFEQISPPDGWLTVDGVVSQGELPAGDAVLSVTMDVEEAALDLFHGWYDEEHLPKLVAVPGFDAARRFRAVAGALAEPGRQRFLALYELAGLEVLKTRAWAEASSMTPRTEQIVPHVTIFSQMYRRPADADVDAGGRRP